MKSNLDKFDNSIPVDLTAALVKSGGYSFNNPLENEGYDSPLPYPTKFQWKDRHLVGKKFGKLTVIGKHTGKGWVCKCLCGIYTIRRGNSVKHGNADSMCERCSYEKALANGLDFRTEKNSPPLGNNLKDSGYDY